MVALSLIAAHINVPELEISGDEATAVQDALGTLAEEYDFSVLLSSRTEAWMGLIGVLVPMIGVRVFAYKMRTAPPLPVATGGRPTAAEMQAHAMA